VKDRLSAEAWPDHLGSTFNMIQCLAPILHVYDFSNWQSIKAFASCKFFDVDCCYFCISCGSAPVFNILTVARIFFSWITYKSKK
jgi:hypothetical protein